MDDCRTGGFASERVGASAACGCRGWCGRTTALGVSDGTVRYSSQCNCKGQRQFLHEGFLGGTNNRIVY
ncbi:hypothetical protein RRSWK_04910 [Rhodopirellula sp. SWK7]|nr:hypothetical protein RRSWK_04910 [Rhodopirellula sp. SWK7]